jgi:hypothetical protein
VATDLDAFLDQVYPSGLLAAWPTTPVIPPEFEVEDMLAALAVNGPFAMFLEKKNDTEYVMDVSFMEKYPVKKGLLKPGGTVTFEIVKGKLETRGILYQGNLSKPGTDIFNRASKVFLCGMNTLSTTLLHNVTFHLSYVTPVVVSCTNELNPNHPIRRLLHPAGHTALIGNLEVGKLQIGGKNGFSTRLFSHEYPALCVMVNDHISKFKVAHLDPDHIFKTRGLVDAPIKLPYWGDEMALWSINKSYAEKYVNYFYANDQAVAADDELRRFADSLDRLLPAGLYDKDSYLTSGMPWNRDSFIRFCATFIHVSSSIHDTLNNAVWDYSVHNAIVPTMAPENLEPQDVMYSFDF